MRKMTGPGKYKYLQSAPNDWTILLYNYDIDGKRHKKEHEPFLNTTVVPYLKARCGIAIYGLTSSTGAVEYDRALGAHRALDLLSHLQSVVGGPFPVNRLVTLGKSKALQMTGKDNTENDLYRGVWLRVWDKLHPPVDIIDPGVINRNFSISDPNLVSFSKGMDIVGGVLSIADLGLDLAASYSSIAAFATGGIMTGVAGFALAIVATIIGMPVVWASADAAAQFNGQVEGYDEAMQDMAEQYQDDSLERKPVKTWPAVREPSPHLFTTLPIGASASAWRAGQAHGCRLAYMDILKLELNPIDCDAVDKSGKKIKIKANGKMILRSLWKVTNGDVAELMVKRVNEALKQKGKAPWPTT